MKYDFDVAIFDMDGTLLDTMPYWRLSAVEYALLHQWPLREDMLIKMPYTSSRKLVLEYAQTIGVQVETGPMIREMEGFMNRHYLYDAHFKDRLVPDFLEMLRGKGIKMCVATGSPREFARNGLRRLGILDYFEFVTDNYETPLVKKQPEYFHQLAQRLGTVPERCWVFEDALYAMESAVAAGMRVCAVMDHSQVWDFDKIRRTADICIQSYSELMEEETSGNGEA